LRGGPQLVEIVSQARTSQRKMIEHTAVRQLLAGFDQVDDRIVAVLGVEPYSSAMKRGSPAGPQSQEAGVELHCLLESRRSQSGVIEPNPSHGPLPGLHLRSTCASNSEQSIASTGHAKLRHPLEKFQMSTGIPRLEWDELSPAVKYLLAPRVARLGYFSTF